MAPVTMTKQPCPFCKKNTLTLTENAMEIPYFGKVYVFSMQCTSCKVNKSDVEADEAKEGSQYTFNIETKKDINTRIVKGSEATVSFKDIGDIEPGPASQGFVTNIEGLLQRLREEVETLKKNEDDEKVKKKIEERLSKINRIIAGKEKAQLIIKDPTGNSAIISQKAKKKRI